MHKYPEKATNPDGDGEELFWEDKRFPEPLEPSELPEGYCFQFVASMSMLISEILDIEVPSQDIVNQIIHEKLLMEIEDAKTREVDKSLFEMSATETIQLFKQKVKSSVINTDVKLTKAIDISDHKHYDLILNFIHSAANLRAQNFKLPESSKLKVQVLVYKIKPYMNVTSSLGGSLCSLEVLKMVSGISKEMYRAPHIHLNRSSIVFDRQ